MRVRVVVFFFVGIWGLERFRSGFLGSGLVLVVGGFFFGDRVDLVGFFF